MMRNKLKLALRYFKYLKRAKHINGHGIHSPFVYEFVKEVLLKKDPDSNYTPILNYKKQLTENNQLIDIEDYGAGSYHATTGLRKISDVARYATTRKKYGKLLARMVNFYSPVSMVELGTSLGIGTSFLSTFISNRTQFFSIEGDTEIYKIAHKHIESYGNKNIQLIHGRFEKKLPEVIDNLESVDFVFFDGNHKLNATLEYFETCLRKINNNSIFIFDDIHWSDEMECAWDNILKHPKSKVCIDLFQFGIVFFRKELSKQHYTIWF